MEGSSYWGRPDKDQTYRKVRCISEKGQKNIPEGGTSTYANVRCTKQADTAGLAPRRSFWEVRLEVAQGADQNKLRGVN